MDGSNDEQELESAAPRLRVPPIKESQGAPRKMAGHGALWLMAALHIRLAGVRFAGYVPQSDLA
jgi:hypothetical protein